MPSFRRVFAAATAVVGITIFVAPPASAGTVTSAYHCLPAPTGATYTMEIIAPATAARGSTVTIEANVTGIDKYSSAYPFEKPGGMNITLGGASSGTVEATGATSPPIPVGGVFRLIGGHAQVTLPNAGDVTFMPDNWYTIINPPAGGRLYCFTHSSVAAATTHVS